MDVCCECCVFSGRGLCGGLITCPEESYRLWRVVVCSRVGLQRHGFGGGGNGKRFCSNYAGNTNCLLIEFIRLGKQARGICFTPLYGLAF
jgi:hypothetical protein